MATIRVGVPTLSGLEHSDTPLSGTTLVVAASWRSALAVRHAHDLLDFTCAQGRRNREMLEEPSSAA